jgi:predicted DNA-binding protein (MmcQ/YjbR family)
MNVERLQKYCLSLPHVTEDVKWDDNLCFLIAEKIFCLAHFGGDFACALKVNEEDFFELTERDGIIQASHFARNKWIAISESSSLTKKEWEHYLKQSYELVKAKLPKKVLSQLN